MASDNASPKVSIVTPSYNQGKFVEKTILSVLCQNYSNLEYIFVDAVSNDETPDILERYRDRIDVLIIEPDKGQTDALNKGFQRATGDILAYINSDDCYANPRVISTAVQHFLDNPEIDVIYGRRNVIDDEGKFLHCMPYRPFSKDMLMLSDYIPQECVFWRRSIFEKSGFYVDMSFDFAMDYELWFRFLDHGAKFLSVNTFFGLFRWYADQKSQDQWRTKGLPEIARLHQKYLNQEIEEKVMIGYFQEHNFLVNPLTQKEAFSFCSRLWETTNSHKRRVWRRRSLDEWMFEINPKRQVRSA